MKALLVEGSLSRWLWTLSWPMLVGFVSLSSVPLVDVILISDLGSLPRAMISLILPLTLVAMGLPVGLNIALSTILARHIGEKQIQKIASLFTFAVSFMAVLSFVIALGVTFWDESLYRLLGSNNTEGITLIRSYFIPWIWGWCPITVVVSINSIFRAQGLPRPVSSIMLFAALIHVIADLILVKGWGPIPSIGMAGAGWAQVVTGITALVFSFYWQKRVGVLKYWKWEIPELEDIRILYSQMAAASFAYVLPVMAQILIQRALVQVDVTALSVYGAIARLEVIGTMPVMAVSSALTPLIAQNRGAMAFNRCRRAIRVAIIYGTMLCLFYLALLHGFKDAAANLFNIVEQEERMLFISMLYTLTPAWLLWGFCFVPLGSFYGSERSEWVLKSAAARLCALFFLLQIPKLTPLQIVQMMTFSQGIYALAVAIGLYKVMKLYQSRNGVVVAEARVGD